MKPRYSIVRVDNNCPFYTELVTTKCWIYKNDKSCFKCKIKKTYGDTKEQLIKKVAQALYKDGLKLAKGIEVDKKTLKQLWKSQYKLAKEIVEFLGVDK